VTLLRLWFSLAVPVSRRAYLLSGVSLMLFKYLVEALIAYIGSGEALTPLQFINPSFDSREQVAGNVYLLWGLAIWSLPFLWIGVGMSVRRSLEAGHSPWLGTLFFSLALTSC